MWASTVPASPMPSGQSVITMFIRTWCGGGASLPPTSSRIFLASSIHASLRNWGTSHSSVSAGDLAGAEGGRTVAGRRWSGSEHAIGDLVVDGQHPDHVAADELSQIDDRHLHPT